MHFLYIGRLPSSSRSIPLHHLPLGRYSEVCGLNDHSIIWPQGLFPGVLQQEVCERCKAKKSVLSLSLHVHSFLRYYLFVGCR